MSNSVDNRVVSMEFDNAKFERNVAQSLETLKHLDKSLDGLADSSKKFDGVSFEDLANSIDSIAQRFTLMGRITQKVFDEIATGIVDLGKKLIDFNLNQVTSGWDKYADKTNSVQTIMNATGREIEYVEEQLDRLNRFTDETSYSFTDMTSNIAKFTSQGIALDEAVTSMQGIATWAASAGQNAQAASRAMYNISQAMGAGSMKLIDWKSIQNANMATKEFKEQAIAAGLAAETLEEQEGKIVVANSDVEVSIKNFEQTLQKGWFNTEAMSKVFTEYGKFADLVDSTYEQFDEKITVSKLLQLAEAQKTLSSSFEDDLSEAVKGTKFDVEELRAAVTQLNAEEYEFSMKTYKAAQEARTFGDSISATADAVSTAWMNVFQTIFGNYEQQRVLWTDMAYWFYELFAEPVNKLQEFLSEVMDGTEETASSSYTLQEAMDRSGVSLLDFGDAAVQALKNQGLLTDEMIESAGSIEAAMSQVTGTSDQFRSVIDEMLASNTGGLKNAEEAFQEYKKVAQEVLAGDWGNGAERRSALEAAGYDAKTVQIFADKMHLGLGVVEDDMWRVSLKTQGFTDAEIEALEKFRDSLIETGETADDTTNKLMRMTGRDLLFGKEEGARGAIYNLMDAITELGKVVVSAWEDIFGSGGDDKVQKVHNMLVAFNLWTRNLLETIKTSENLASAFRGFFAVVDIVRKAISAVFQIFKNIINIFAPVNSGIGDLVGSFGDLLVQIDKWIDDHKIFERVVNTVTEAFKGLKTVLDPLIQRVKELWGLFKANISLQNVSKIFTSIFTTARTVGASALTFLRTAFSNLVTSISEFATKHFPTLLTSVRTFFNQFKSGEKTLVGEFTRIKNAVVDFFTILRNFIKTRDYDSFVKSFSERFEGLATVLKNTKKSVEDWFNSIDKDSVKTILKLATSLLTLITVFKLLQRFGTIHGAIVGMFNNISSLFTTLKRNVQTNNVYKIATAIGVLVAAMIVLAYIPADKMKQGMTALGEIMGGFLVIMGLASVIAIKGNPATMSALAGTIGGIAALLISAVASLWILTTKIDYSRIWEALGTLFGVLAMAVTGCIVVSRLAGPAAIGIKSTLALALALLAMVYALEKIQNSAAVLSPSTFKKFFTLIGMLALASFALKRGVSLGSALGLLVFILSLSLINKKLVQLMDEIPPAEQYESKMDDLWGLIRVVMGIALALRVAGKNRFGASLGIIAAIIGVYELAKLAVRLGEVDAVKLAHGVNVVESIGYMLSAVILMMGVAANIAKGSKGFSAAVIAIVIAMIAIGIEMVALADIAKNDWESLKRGIMAMGSVMLALSIVLVSMGYLAKNVHSLGTALLTIIVIIGLLASVVIAITKLQSLGDPSTMLSTAESLALVVAALGVAMFLLSKSTSGLMGFDSNAAWQMIIAFVILAGAALGALLILNGMNITTSIETVGSLCLLIAVLAFAAMLLSMSKSSLGNAGGQALLVLALAASLVLVATALQKLDSINVEGILPKAEALARLIAAIGGIAFMFSLIPDIGSWAGMGRALVAFFVIILGLTGYVALLGTFGDSAEEGGTALEKGATILGRAIANFVNAFKGDGDPAKTEEPVSKLQKLAQDLKGLIEVLNGISLDAASVDSLAGVLIALGKAELSDAIANFINLKLGGDNGGLTEKLTGFAQAVTAYVQTIQTVTDADIQKATDITNAVSQLLVAMPKEGGVAGWLLGARTTGMSNLGNNLGEFGKQIKKFCEDISGLTQKNVDDVTRFKNLVTPIVNISNSLQRSDGALQWIIGQSNLKSFGEKLASFVSSLFGGEGGEGVLDLIAKITDDHISSVTTKLQPMVEALVAATSSIPQLGGVLDVIFGTDSPASFGTQMVTFCEKVIEIGDKAEGITDTHIDSMHKATEAAYALNAFTNAMYGTNLPESAAEGVPQVTEDLAEGARNLASADFDKAKANADAAAEMQKSLSGVGSATGGTGGFDVGSLLDADGISAALSGLPAIATTAVSGITSAFTSGSGSMQAAASELMQGAITGITEKEEPIRTEGETAAGKAVEGLKGKNEDAGTAGGEFIASFASGITTKISETDLFSGLSTALSTNLSENAGDVQAVGASMVASFIGGLESKRTDAYNAGSIPVDEALRGISEKGKLYEDEPESMKLGKFFGDGFIKGAETKLNKAHEMGAKIANELLAGIKSKETDATTKGTEVGESFLNALDLYLQANQEAIQGSGTSFVSYVNTGIEAGGETMTAAGLALTTSAGEGITSGEEAVTGAATDVAASGVASLEQGASGAITAGEMFALGFAQGIMNKAGEIASAAAEVARSALAAVQGEIDSHSPSRETMKFGSYFGEGFAIGIRDTVSLVESDATGLASAALDAVSTAAQLAADIVESDVNPVITPVLDLSEVHRQAAGISNLGGFAASVSASRAGMVSDAVTARQIQNGTPIPQTAVLSDSAIKALMSKQQAPGPITIEFTGDLAQLARVLHPVILDQYNYHGDSLIK